MCAIGLLVGTVWLGLAIYRIDVASGLIALGVLAFHGYYGLSICRAWRQLPAKRAALTTR